MLESEEEQKTQIKTVIDRLKLTLRKLGCTLQDTHVEDSTHEVIEEYINNCRAILKDLGHVIPPGQFEKYHDLWRSALQQLVANLCFQHWLQSKVLLSYEDTAKQLDIASMSSEHVFLPLNDYLVGLCDLPSVIIRYTLNKVIRNDYSSVYCAHEFITALFSSFKLLNLKNDHLRRRFDSIKYEAKRIEEIVYDLVLRKILPPIDDK
eukprot:GCRY01004817.1.p1 GENE.GCRY01004817.1~~GCRY01004817.1.p1  ORF type:complete len:237 (-),score=14.17 GCRY01004817.1:124-744(-)